MNIKIEIDGKEVKSALIKEILEQDTLEKAAFKIAELQYYIPELCQSMLLAKHCGYEYKEELQRVKERLFGAEKSTNL